MAKSLVMKFASEGGKNLSLTIPNINETNVTVDAVKVLGANIIAKKIFNTSGGYLVKLTAAHIDETTSTSIL